MPPIPFRRLLLIALVSWLAWEYFSLPGIGIVNLAGSDPGFSALMKRRWEESGAQTRIHYEFVPLDRIAPSFQRAVLACEDGGFYRHSGIDWRALRNAYERNERSGRVRFGGSTITMQLAKNLYLSNDRSYLRKLKEAVLTFRLEKHLSKKRILELYLNIIELGDGIFGVEAASQHYFHKPASKMTRDESIRLAAIISSPIKHDPFENSRFMGIRKGIILRKMGG